MRCCAMGFLVMAMTLGAWGCAGDVETTDDSTRIEAEVPRVELGPADTDLDPSTDQDVDIDTPASGDS